MPFRKLITAALLIGAAVPMSVTAQTAGQPAGQPLGGPVVAGVCLLSREAVFANAAVGKAASARLAELTRTAQAEIDAERGPLETEAKALQGQPDNAPIRQKREALGTRWQALQGKAAHNSREIEATRAKAMERIALDTQPVIAQVYAQKKCGLLLDRGAALGGNFANDLTADVVRGVDAKVKTITFERERLAQQPVAAAPAAR